MAPASQGRSAGLIHKPREATARCPGRTRSGRGTGARGQARRARPHRTPGPPPRRGRRDLPWQRRRAGRQRPARGRGCVRGHRTVRRRLQRHGRRPRRTRRHRKHAPPRAPGRSGRHPAPRRARCSGDGPATSPYRPTTTGTARPNWRCSGRTTQALHHPGGRWPRRGPLLADRRPCPPGHRPASYESAREHLPAARRRADERRSARRGRRGPVPGPRRASPARRGVRPGPPRRGPDAGRPRDVSVPGRAP